MAVKESIFAEKLEKLFEQVRKLDGSRYTQAEVVEGTGGVLTRVYLWKLRKGHATNPGFHIIEALADFFAVDTNYFSQGEQHSEDVGKARPIGRYLAQIQARAAQLDDRAQKAILDLMDFLLSIQPNVPPGEPGGAQLEKGNEIPWT